MSEDHEETDVGRLSRPAKKKDKRKKKKPQDEYNLPGVGTIIIPEICQKTIGCVVGENVTNENPWIFVKKDTFVNTLDLNEGSSDYLNIKEHILQFPGEQLLLGYIPDESSDTDKFYVVYTEEAIKEVKEINEKRQEEQLQKLEASINRTTFEWNDLGSEAEVDEGIVTNTRSLIQVELESQYPMFSSITNFTCVRAEDRRDGYMELKVPENLFKNIYRKRIDEYVQAAPEVLATEAQTICTYPENAYTQYEYDVENVEKLFQQCQENIVEYVTENYDKLSDILTVNGVIDLYGNDYSRLSTSEEFDRSAAVLSINECNTFMDVNLCNGKVVSNAAWHSLCSGILAIAYCEASPIIYRWGENTTDIVLTTVHNKHVSLIWSSTDGLHPRLILESPREVYKISFCKVDGNIIIGGCSNGQILIWDITGKIEKVEQLEVLTTAQQKYRSLMHSLIGWMKNIKDISLVKPAAVSDLKYSHKGAVTDIVWLSPLHEFNKIGNLNEIPEDSEKGYSLQFITSSDDGTILIWDLLKKPTVHPGGFKIRKLKRLSKRPSALLLESSPFEVLHLNLKPIYKVNYQKKEKKFNWITSCQGKFDKIRYEEVSGSKKLPSIYERVRYRPIFERGDPPKSVLHVGTLDGEYASIKWDGQDFDSGEIVNSEPAQILNTGRYHDGPINCIQICYTGNVILTIGGKIFALWHVDYPNKPLFWRKNDHLLTTGQFHIIEPYLFTLVSMDGKAQIWMIFAWSKKPACCFQLSNSFLTNFNIHERRLKTPIVAAGDRKGNCRLFSISQFNPPEKIAEYHTLFELYISRELKYKKMYNEWLKEWCEENSEIILEYEGRLKERADREKAEAEKLAKDQEEEKEPVVKLVRLSQMMKEKRRADEIVQIRKRIIEKKQLDTKELDRRRKPLIQLEEENERKKRKQKQRLKEGEQIFRATVTSLFPQFVKAKPIPPPDPYAVEDATDVQIAHYNEYVNDETTAETFLAQNPYTYYFNWKKIVSSGRIRRRLLDEKGSDITIPESTSFINVISVNKQNTEPEQGGIKEDDDKEELSFQQNEERSLKQEEDPSLKQEEEPTPQEEMQE